MKKENKNECNSIFNPMYFIYLWYKYWRRGLKEEYGHDKLGPGDQFMYIKHILGITIGVMGIIIMLIRLIIYGNIYYPSPW